MSPMIGRRLRTRFAVLSLMASAMLMGSASPALTGPVTDLGGDGEDGVLGVLLGVVLAVVLVVVGLVVVLL